MGERQACKVFVGGLSWETTDDKLRAYFENFGAVREAFVSYNRNNGRPRGFGFVVFESPEVAEKVVAAKHTIDRREVEAKKAVPKDEADEQRGVGGPVGAASSGSQQQAGSKTSKIFVGGLAPTVDETVLRQYFTRFGEVEDAVVMYDHENKRPRGFGFVKFVHEESVDQVFGQGNMQSIMDKQIEIKAAVPRDQMMPPPGQRTPPFHQQHGRGPPPYGAGNYGGGNLHYGGPQQPQQQHYAAQHGGYGGRGGGQYGGGGRGGFALPGHSGPTGAYSQPRGPPAGSRQLQNIPPAGYAQGFPGQQGPPQQQQPSSGATQQQPQQQGPPQQNQQQPAQQQGQQQGQQMPNMGRYNGPGAAPGGKVGGPLQSPYDIAAAAAAAYNPMPGVNGVNAALANSMFASFAGMNGLQQGIPPNSVNAAKLTTLSNYNFTQLKALSGMSGNLAAAGAGLAAAFNFNPSGQDEAFGRDDGAAAYGRGQDTDYSDVQQGLNSLNLNSDFVPHLSPVEGNTFSSPAAWASS